MRVNLNPHHLRFRLRLRPRFYSLALGLSLHRYCEKKLTQLVISVIGGTLKCYSHPNQRDPPFFSKTARIATLGPEGTSSQAAAQYVANFVGTVEAVQLFPSFEESAETVQKGNADLFVVAHAYSEISRFYMDPEFDLFGVFLHDTPSYGLAIRRGQKVVWSEKPRIVTHPAPVPLLKYLAPAREFVVEIVRSTSEAAQSYC